MIVYAGRSVRIRRGRLWWKHHVWIPFCGCTWVGHRWGTKAGSKAELDEHMKEHGVA